MISTSRVNLYIHCLYLLILHNKLVYFKWILLITINIYLLFLMMSLILCDRLVNLNEIS